MVNVLIFMMIVVMEVLWKSFEHDYNLYFPLASNVYNLCSYCVSVITANKIQFCFLLSSLIKERAVTMREVLTFWMSGLTVAFLGHQYSKVGYLLRRHEVTLH